MKWYYSKRGDIERHGVTDDEGVADMVRRGVLQPEDLLCSESTGGKWIPASAVSGLMAPPAPPSLHLVPSPAAEARAPRAGSRRLIAIASILLAAAALAAAALLLLTR